MRRARHFDVRSLIASAPSDLHCWLLDAIADKTEWHGRCLVWTGQAAHSGHGRIVADRKQFGTHRIVLEAKLGRLLDAQEHARHRCDVPRCVNPEHLEPGSCAENVGDKVSRGRHRRPRWPRGAPLVRCQLCLRYVFVSLPGWPRCELSDEFLATWLARVAMDDDARAGLIVSAFGESLRGLAGRETATDVMVRRGVQHAMRARRLLTPSEGEAR